MRFAQIVKRAAAILIITAATIPLFSQELTAELQADGYLTTAQNAVKQGDFDKAYTFITKIQNLRDGSSPAAFINTAVMSLLDIKEIKEIKEMEEKGFVLVEAGSFQMGSRDGGSDEEPVHTVRISGDFYMSKYEVTHAQFIEFLNDAGVDSDGEYRGVELIDMDDSDCAVGYRSGRFYFKGSGDADEEACPVMEITWYGAVEYCNWLSREEGLEPAYSGSGDNIRCDFSADGYRLPTEAEWEYAARGGKESKSYKYAGSNDIDDVAWWDDNSGGKTRPVGGKQPNELGLYDMSGNVWEWCWDWYDDYPSGTVTDPSGPSSGSGRVLRGGSWYGIASDCRSADRNPYNPSNSINRIGFRLVRRP